MSTCEKCQYFLACKFCPFNLHGYNHAKGACCPHVSKFSGLCRLRIACVNNEDPSCENFKVLNEEESYE